MKLRNKKTGEIRELPDGFICGDNLKKICEEWEDYEEPKEYWFIDCDGDVDNQRWDGDDYDKRMMLIGNYFKTKEEAELAIRKLKAWKRLKDKGVIFDGCFDRFAETHKHRDVVVFLLKAEAPDYGEKSCDKIEDDLDLLFGGEE